MILVDTNLLVYARASDFPQHSIARDWLDRLISDGPRVGLPWNSLVGFMRIVTNPRILKQPESIHDAWKQVTAWLQPATVWIPVPTDRHPDILAQLLPHTAGRPNLIPDADLAALAIEHGLTLCSADGDFARFPGLRWENPLLTPQP